MSDFQATSARGRFRTLRRSVALGLTFSAALFLTGAITPPGDAPVADAVMRGDTVMLRQLIKEGVDVNEAQADGMTALHWAASRGDAKSTQTLVFSGARVDALTRNGNYTPLHLAARNGHAAAAKALLEHGADANATTSSGGATALHFASSNGDSETVDILLVKGAKVDARETAFQQTPLMWAAANNRVPAIRALLKHGADIEAVSLVEDMAAREKSDRAALIARARKVAAIKAAEAAPPAAVVAGTPNGAAADSKVIADAIVKDVAKAEVVAVARSMPSDPAGRAGAVNRADSAGPADSTATRVAARREAVRDSAARPTRRDSSMRKDDAAVKDVADAKVVDVKAADPKKISDKDKSMSAKEAPAGVGRGGRGGAEAAPMPGAPGDTTRRAGADGFNNRGLSFGELIGKKGGLTPLLFAVREGHVEATAALLEAGAKINHVSNGDHTSPLLMAAMNGQFDLAMMLMSKSPDVKLASDAGATPLYVTINSQWAAKSLYPQPTAQKQQHTSHLELMEALLKAGADPNARLTKHLWYMSYNFDLLGVNTEGATPFWRAAYGTDVPAMKLLTKYGADPNIATVKPNGRLPGDDSPTDEPGKEGSKDPSGLPPIPKGGPGVYPIQAAAGVGYGEGYAANAHEHAPDGWIPSLKYLIEDLHMDVNSRDFNGYTPLHHAAARGDNAAIEYLMSKGADIHAVSRRGQTVADMANGPVSRIVPFPETVALLEKLGSKNNHSCKSC